MDEELFVVGDVHGQSELLKAVLAAISATPRTMSTRRLIFLGDLIDRGPSSIESVEIAMRGTEHSGSDFVHILPGNHDLMLVDAVDDEERLEHWVMNGGKTVLDELGLSWPKTPWARIAKTLNKVLDAGYLEMMRVGSTHFKAGDLLCVHAGIDPHSPVQEFLALDRRKISSDQHWATMRYPFLNWEGGWDQNDISPRRRERRPTVIVHGHTPALRSDLKADADLGICDGIDEFRALDLDIGAAYRPQLGWAQFRTNDGCAEVKVCGVRI